MLKVNFHEQISDGLLKFAVIIAKTNGKWVFCKHKKEIHTKFLVDIENQEKIFSKPQGEN